MSKARALVRRVPYDAWWKGHSLPWRVKQRVWWVLDTVWSAMRGDPGPGERILLMHLRRRRRTLQNLRAKVASAASVPFSRDPLLAEVLADVADGLDEILGNPGDDRLGRLH